MIGNVQPLLAAAVVIGFRWPAAWAFVILTKIAPGIGLLWFAFRREWRNLGIALAATAIIAAVSFVFAPQQWADFVRFAMANVGAPSPNPVVPIPLAGADRDVGRDDRLGRPDEPPLDRPLRRGVGVAGPLRMDLADDAAGRPRPRGLAAEAAGPGDGATRDRA